MVKERGQFLAKNEKGPVFQKLSVTQIQTPIIVLDNTLGCDVGIKVQTVDKALAGIRCQRSIGVLRSVNEDTTLQDGNLLL